jgi:hypothetical protein
MCHQGDSGMDGAPRCGDKKKAGESNSQKRKMKLARELECSADLVFASNHDNKKKIWSVQSTEMPNGNSESRRPKFIDTRMDGKSSDEV